MYEQKCARVKKYFLYFCGDKMNEKSKKQTSDTNLFSYLWIQFT